MKNIGIKLAAVAFLLAASAPAFAGKGGSAANINAAVASSSVDAIIAEVERAEKLMCDACIDTMTQLTAHPRYEVREVAAWWFAKRPTYHKLMADQFAAELVGGTSLEVRNAADFLGASSTFRALPQLRAAIRRSVDRDAKLAIVRAVDALGNLGGNDVLTVAMADGDAKVRAAAVRAWRDIRGQKDAAPIVALLGDSDVSVRAEAATVVGGLKQATAAGALETLVVSDPSPIVRKNAAWALGKIGATSSRTALAEASNDASGLVRMTARASLTRLR
jgi:HEAT repeat protein